MYDSEIIIRLYETVLKKKRDEFRIKKMEFRKAVDMMNKAYAPEPSILSTTDVICVDYNNPAFRCAYLHKYAPIHTALVADVLDRINKKDSKVFSSMDSIELCSLGGGPGTDVIGVLAAFSNINPRIRISANILDCMKEWKETFDTLTLEIKNGEYGLLSDCVWVQNWDWKTYIETDLYNMDDKACRAIASANLITMVKFVSAAASEELHSMIRKIFSLVKPGARILYIDNDSQKFHSILQDEAKRHKLKMAIPPFEHEHFTDIAFKKSLFGHIACFETTVAVYMWKKPLTILNNLNILQPIPINLEKIKSVKLKKSDKKIYVNNSGQSVKLINNFDIVSEQSNRIQDIQKSVQKNLNIALQVNHVSCDQNTNYNSPSFNTSEQNLALSVNHVSCDQNTNYNSPSFNTSEQSSPSNLIDSTETESYHYRNSSNLSVSESTENISAELESNSTFINQLSQIKDTSKLIKEKALGIFQSSLTTILGIALNELFSPVWSNNFNVIDTDEFLNYMLSSL